MPSRYTRPTQQHCWGTLAPTETETQTRPRGVIGLAEAGAPIYACGPKLCHFELFRDMSWKHDQFHYHLIKRRAAPLGKKFTGRWSKWEQSWHVKTIPPPADRHEIYRLLISSTAEALPTSYLKSRIPWNQLGYGWVGAYGWGKESEKKCGDIIQYFFDRYMVWSFAKRRSLLRSGTEEFDPAEVIKACQTIATRLKDNKPTRIGICTADDKQKTKRASGVLPHYLGIVACDSSEKRFLAIEPWVGNNSGAKYGPTVTSRFLAEIKHNAVEGVLEYANGTGRWANARVLVVDS